MSRSLALSVELPRADVVVVHVAGVLDRMTAPRLARLLDAQLDRCLAVNREASDRARACGRAAHVVVHLGEVSFFGPGGLSVLRHAHYTAREAGVGLVLAGLTARAGLLPEWAAGLVAGFDGYPTVEDALTALTRPPTPAPAPSDPPPAIVLGEWIDVPRQDRTEAVPTLPSRAGLRGPAGPRVLPMA